MHSLSLGTQRNRPRQLVGMAVVLAILAAQPVRASVNLQRELGEVAKDLKKYLDGHHEQSVSVGAFTGPSYLESSSGPVISKVLTEQLQKAGVRVERRANYEIKGDYVDVVDKRSDHLAARLKVRLLDRVGTEVIAFERGIFGDATLSSLFGLTVSLPPDGTPQLRDQKMRDSIDKPKAAVRGARISSNPSSPFAISVRVAPQSGGMYEDRPAKDVDGFAFVPIARGEVYGIEIINDADYEVAVTITIDGISMFAFSDDKDPRTGQPLYDHLIISPRKKTFIKGWYRNQHRSEEFLVTEYARSAAAELHSAAPVGTITVCFAACWPQGSNPPPDEPANPAEHSRSADATGRGAQFQQNYQKVERHFGVVRDSISVRYTK